MLISTKSKPASLAARSFSFQLRSPGMDFSYRPRVYAFSIVITPEPRQ